MKLLIPLLLFFIGNRDSGCLEMDIVIVADYSGSVIGHEGQITEALNGFIDEFELSETTIKIGIVHFNNSATIVSHLTSRKPLLQANLELLKKQQANGLTNMGDAFNVATNELSKNGRPTARKMIILVTDGEPQNKDEVGEIATLIKMTNIGICGVLIKGHQYDMEYLKRLCSDQCFTETSYTTLLKSLKEIDLCL